MTSPCRIAFHLNLDDQWTGGVSYYENLFRALELVSADHDFQLLGFFSEHNLFLGTLLSRFHEVYKIPNLNLDGKNFLTRLLIKNSRLLNLEPVLSRIMREQGADIAFVRADPGYNYKIPTLSWFPDFQYLHYPEMFSPKEVYQLGQCIKDIGRYSTRVILSSEAAKEDFFRVVPQFSHKARVLSFASFLDKVVYAQNVHEICSEYHLPERFFLLPNQLWKHKNHRVVLDALSLVRHKEPDIMIVSTGLLSDYRNPNYSSEFLAEVSRSGNRNNFIFLGILPRNHVYAIMRQAVAVIQPSLFEGWSTIVEEVKSVGKMIILSDLKVHREQDPPLAEYFDPLDPRSLAEKILLVYDHTPPGPDLQLEEFARKNFSSRFKLFGESFLSIVKDVLDR